MTAFFITHALCLPLFTAQLPPPASDWIIPAGQTVIYDTANGPVDARNVIVESNATLRIVGTQSFRLRASRLLQIDGKIDLSGKSISFAGVATLNTTSISEPGADGAAGGGHGGTGNVLTNQSNAVGGDAFDAFGQLGEGGKGGESGFSPIIDCGDARRAAGGGGGALGPDQPVNPNPNDLLNIGRIARAGFAGAATAQGAITLQSPPQGGAHASIPFVDANLDNDFWGRKLDLFSGQILVGELARPLAGRGGGAGGNAINFGSFPLVPWTPDGDEKGCGGGGGGGLGVITALAVRFGPQGKLVDNGGRGGGGENSTACGGITRIGGGSGGGSGGYLVVQARVIDLSHASAAAITALGGRGGQGMNDIHNESGAGGDGGPGLIQLHVPANGTSLLLPAGVPLSTLTAPTAHVLLPEPIL